MGFEFEGRDLFVLWACGTKEGFYVGFYLDGSCYKTGFGIVEGFVAGNAGVAERNEGSDYGSVFGFEVVEGSG